MSSGAIVVRFQQSVFLAHPVLYEFNPTGHYPCFFEPFHGFKSHFIWQHSLFLQLKSLISIIIRFNPQLLASSPFPKPSPSLPQAFPKPSLPLPLRWTTWTSSVPPHWSWRRSATGRRWSRNCCSATWIRTIRTSSAPQPCALVAVGRISGWWPDDVLLNKCRLDDWFGWTFAKRCYHHPMAVDVLVAAGGELKRCSTCSTFKYPLWHPMISY